MDFMNAVVEHYPNDSVHLNTYKYYEGSVLKPIYSKPLICWIEQYNNVCMHGG